MTSFYTCILLLGLISPAVLVELLDNPDFEGPALGKWFSVGKDVKLATVSDAISGLKSLKVTQRNMPWNGPRQVVELQSETSYQVSGYVKILNDRAGKLFQRVDVSVSYEESNGPTTYTNVATQSRVTTADGWVCLKGTFRTPARPFVKATLYLQSPDPGIDFQVDAMSLKKLAPYWRIEADTRIEKYRKSDVTLRVQLTPGFIPQEIELEIRHVKHSFPFGTVVSDDHVLNATFAPYQDLLFGMFNWFTVGTYKWEFAQGPRNMPDYTKRIQVTDKIRQKGYPVRAHCMFWDVEGRDPDWLRALSPSALNTAVSNRIKFMTDITRGKVQHWDVNNEVLAGAFYEEKTGDPDYTKKIFSWVRQADPNVKLFLNENNVVARGSSTKQYVDLAKKFKQANVGLYGLGLQGHFSDNVEPDPALLKVRLDMLSEVGLPLWVTELDMNVEDPGTRADWYETAWRMFYSHPAVEGLLMWGFWDRLNFRAAGGSLVSGNSYFINEAGQRWLHLTKEEWTTKLSYPVASGDTTTFRGFQGDYEVIVKKNGQPIKLLRFSLGKTALLLNILVDGSGHPISVPPPPTLPPFVPRDYPHRVFTAVNQRSLGVVTSGRSRYLKCVNRWSKLSAVGDDQKAVVSCQRGEVMTSCSAITQDKGYLWDGVQFEDQHGRLACAGTNGFRSTDGVFAQARCCKRTGLSCGYRKSGPPPDPLRDGDREETTCPPRTIATGCLFHSYWTGVHDGAFHKPRSCIAQLDAVGQELHGVYSEAVCCSAPRLRCRIVLSGEGARSRGSKVTAQCHRNEVMLGCSVFSEDGRIAGSRISDERYPRCEGVSGTDRSIGERGVQVSAVCCRA